MTHRPCCSASSSAPRRRGPRHCVVPRRRGLAGDVWSVCRPALATLAVRLPVALERLRVATGGRTVQSDEHTDGQSIHNRRRGPTIPADVRRHDHLTTVPAGLHVAATAQDQHHHPHRSETLRPGRRSAKMVLTRCSDMSSRSKMRNAWSKQAAASWSWFRCFHPARLYKVTALSRLSSSGKDRQRPDIGSDARSASPCSA